MELYDLEQEHLQSVLREDDDEASDMTHKNEASPPLQQTRDKRARVLLPEQKEHDDEERYRLLPEYTRTSGLAWDGIPIRTERNEMMMESNPKDKAAKEPPFVLSKEEQRGIPENTTTPTCKRLHEIMKRTAQKAAVTPQFEVLLKVKQSNHVDFQFLRPSHALHPYYQWLKETHTSSPPPKKSHENKAKDSTLIQTKKKNGVLVGGGLLDMYDSSEEEEEEDNNNSNNNNNEEEEMNNDEKQTVASQQQQQQVVASKERIRKAKSAATRSSTDEQKAKRLKRAKMMKGHFALQLLMKKNPSNETTTS